jgi:hypothetical protein
VTSPAGAHPTRKSKVTRRVKTYERPDFFIGFSSRCKAVSDIVHEREELAKKRQPQPAAGVVSKARRTGDPLPRFSTKGGEKEVSQHAYHSACLGGLLHAYSTFNLRCGPVDTSYITAVK